MLENLTLFAMAQKSMDWLARRQAVLAENVANANTPQYQAKDLAPLDFKHVLEQGQQPVQAAVTNPMHIAPPVEPVNFQTVAERTPEESKPDGNTVLIEEQMQKIGDVKSSYELAINIFQKNLSMLKTAIDRGGA